MNDEGLRGILQGLAKDSQDIDIRYLMSQIGSDEYNVEKESLLEYVIDLINNLKGG